MRNKVMLWDYCEKNGYNSGYEITYKEAKELFGEADMSTMSKADWGSPLYEANKVNK